MKSSSVSWCVASLVLLTACSGYQYRAPESIADKMDRYKANNPNPNPSLELKSRQDLLQKGASRGLASKELPETYGLKHSDKRLYFMSLLSQYELMRTMVKNETPNLTICPHFHSSVVEYKEEHGEYKTLHKAETKAKAGGDEALYPELQLKVSNQGLTLKEELANQEKEEVLEKALSNHAKNTFNELRELCEYGVSDNFYAFENLMTHIKNSGFAKNSESANVLFKTPIYANDLIMNSLSFKSSEPTRGPASANLNSTENDYLRELSARMNAHWYYDYVANLKKERQAP
jgi:hypothetical protein